MPCKKEEDECQLIRKVEVVKIFDRLSGMKQETIIYMGDLVKKNDNLLPALMREVEDKTEGYVLELTKEESSALRSKLLTIEALRSNNSTLEESLHR